MKTLLRCIFFYGVGALLCCTDENLFDHSAPLSPSLDFSNIFNGSSECAMDDYWLGGSKDDVFDYGEYGLGVPLRSAAHFMVVSDEDSSPEEDEEHAPQDAAIVCADFVGLMPDCGKKVKSVRKANPPFLREKKLKQLLQKERLCFEDVKYNAYDGMKREVFQLDILNLMHSNADIYEEDGYYRCRGTLKVKPQTSDSIAVAMFKLLQEKPTSFKLKFQLYSQGYREYTPEALGHIEYALVVGGVHPVDHTFLQENSACCKNAKEVWDTVKEFTEDKLQAYLEHPPVKHAAWLSNRRLRRVVQVLWEFKKEGSLDMLQSLICSVNIPAQRCEKKPSGVPYVFTTKTKQRKQMVEVLMRHVNQDLDIHVFQEMVSREREAHCKDMAQSVFLRAFLLLAMDERKIVYNKEAQTVKLLRQAEPGGQPEENTNLLTVLYGLITRYGRHLTQEEIMYYAHRRGYCECDRLGKKKLLSESIRWYREVLALQGYIDVACCTTKSNLEIERQKNIWALVAEEGVVLDLLYYKGVCGKGVTQEDVDAVAAAKKLQETPEYRVFIDYLEEQCKAVTAKKTSESVVMDMLRAGPIFMSRLMCACAEFGLQSAREVWHTVGSLTRRTQGGRLLYDLKTTRLCWDEDDCVPQQKKDSLVAEVFSLRHDNSYMTNQELLHMLKQKGFQDVTLSDVHGILQGLSVLGIQRIYENELVEERGFVDAILSKSDGGYPGWRWAVAQRVADWFRDDTIRNLWVAYLEKTSEVIPQPKRLKTQKLDPTPEDIMRRDMPTGYTILLQKLCE